MKLSFLFPEKKYTPKFCIDQGAATPPGPSASGAQKSVDPEQGFPQAAPGCRTETAMRCLNAAQQVLTGEAEAC